MRTHHVLIVALSLVAGLGFATWLFTPNPRANYAHCDGPGICSPRPNWKERTRLAIVRMFPQREAERAFNEVDLAAQAALNGEHRRAVRLYLDAAERAQHALYLTAAFDSAVRTQDLRLMIEVSEAELRLDDMPFNTARVPARLADLYIRANEPEHAERVLTLLEHPNPSAAFEANMDMYRAVISMQQRDFESAHANVDNAIAIWTNLIENSSHSADESDEVRELNLRLFESYLIKATILATQGDRQSSEEILGTALPVANTALTAPGISRPRVLNNRALPHDRLSVNGDIAFEAQNGADMYSIISEMPCERFIPGFDLFHCTAQRAFVAAE